ncbi:transcriptional regulator with XRE-family HTH domain [Desulfosalsimonas propionicica]|uniref:Transcriptional regulator with XRE-family HTH domain n=1 Tax=Desulfosalsimonas propionicica TaxID=332175 RepID=A0A7W0CBU8_9BACT|nr:transcriptional regulator with XRE-family HTH domain [Desulfosalsimonas propionicica]
MDKRYSLRQVAFRVGVEPSYLSKIERGFPVTLSEVKVRILAEDLGENPDLLLALSGKVSADVQEIIRGRPELFTDLIRQIKNMPENDLLKLVQDLRAGKWYVADEEWMQNQGGQYGENR